MCCIFTCCGWVIDLIQRVWTFAMSCVISSAICCVCFTSSMSGIALGYNYSLAEYIDLKETNVSVYMKRGVFDDAVVDDNKWRRSGHLPVAGHIGEDNLMTGAPEEGEMPLRSGRRLDNSIYEADDRNKFEGSLLKLTAKAPYESITETKMTGDPDLAKIYAEHKMDSPEYFKAIQSLINMRKAAQQSADHGMQKATTIDARYGPAQPRYPPGPEMGGRRIPSNDAPFYLAPTTSNPLRQAVPRLMNQKSWVLPEIHLSTLNYYNDDLVDIVEPNEKPTYPTLITIRTKPLRPTRPSTFIWPTKTGRRAFATPQKTGQPKEKDLLVDESMDALKEKIMLDQFDEPSINVDIPKTKDSKKSDDIYDYEARGLPVRRRRSVHVSKTPSTDFTFRLQRNNNHSANSIVASNDLSKNEKGNNNNASKSYSPKIIEKLLSFFSVKFDISLSKNSVKNETNTEGKGDLIGSLGAFTSFPVEVSRKELLTKTLRSKFLS